MTILGISMMQGVLEALTHVAAELRMVSRWPVIDSSSQICWWQHLDELLTSDDQGVCVHQSEHSTHVAVKAQFRRRDSACTCIKGEQLPSSHQQVSLWHTPHGEALPHHPLASSHLSLLCSFLSLFYFRVCTCNVPFIVCFLFPFLYLLCVFCFLFISFS